jgi:hypothetical protein
MKPRFFSCRDTGVKSVSVLWYVAMDLRSRCATKLSKSFMLAYATLLSEG